MSSRSQRTQSGALTRQPRTKRTTKSPFDVVDVRRRIASFCQAPEWCVATSCSGSLECDEEAWRQVVEALARAVALADCCHCGWVKSDKSLFELAARRGRTSSRGASKRDAVLLFAQAGWIVPAAAVRAACWREALVRAQADEKGAAKENTTLDAGAVARRKQRVFRAALKRPRTSGTAVEFERLAGLTPRARHVVVSDEIVAYPGGKFVESWRDERPTLTTIVRCSGVTLASPLAADNRDSDSRDPNWWTFGVNLEKVRLALHGGAIAHADIIRTDANSTDAAFKLAGIRPHWLGAAAELADEYAQWSRLEIRSCVGDCLHAYGVPRTSRKPCNYETCRAWHREFAPTSLEKIHVAMRKLADRVRHLVAFHGSALDLDAVAAVHAARCAAMRHLRCYEVAVPAGDRLRRDLSNSRDDLRRIALELIARIEIFTRSHVWTQDSHKILITNWQCTWTKIIQDFDESREVSDLDRDDFSDPASCDGLPRYVWQLLREDRLGGSKCTALYHVLSLFPALVTLHKPSCRGGPAVVAVNHSPTPRELASQTRSLACIRLHIQNRLLDVRKIAFYKAKIKLDEATANAEDIINDLGFFPKEPKAQPTPFWFDDLGRIRSPAVEDICGASLRLQFPT